MEPSFTHPVFTVGKTVYSLCEPMTVCKRPDGSTYGTAGKCRKGVAITWGKYNIPTPGHVKVIKELLDKAGEVVVVLSPAKKNVDPNLRKLILRRLLRKAGVDVSRVKLEHGDSKKILRDLIDENGPENVTLGLGEDRRAVAEGAAKKIGINAHVSSRPEGSESSTMMRGLIDSGDMKTLSKIYQNDPYLLRLVTEARKDERDR